MSRPLQIHLVSHAASRTGAPRIAMNLASWLTENTPHRVRITVLEDGPLVEEFRTIDPDTRVLGWASTLMSWTTPEKLAKRVSERGADQIRQRRLDRAAPPRGLGDVLYLNSVACLRAISTPRWPRPVVLHAHELRWGIENQLWSELRDNLATLPDQVIACSEPVRQTLSADFAVKPERISVVPEFLAPAGKSAEGQAEADIDAIMVGTVEQRKGPDLFVQAALAHRRVTGRDVRWRWVGITPKAYEDRLFEDEVRRAGLPAETLQVATSEVRPLLRRSKVLALTSREDPYPLVALEALREGIPVVCFDGTGGIPDLLRRGCGIVVPYADTDAFARAVERLVSDPAYAQQLGATGRRLIEDEHTTATAGPAILEIIERAATANGAAT